MFSKLKNLYTITIAYRGYDPIELDSGVTPKDGTQRGSFFDGKKKYWFFNLNIEQLKYEILQINRNKKFYVVRIERLVDLKFDIEVVQIYPKKCNMYWSEQDTGILMVMANIH